MKSITKIIIGICIIALFCSAASAETANKDLPTKEQVLSFVDSVKDPTVEKLFETLKSENPTWKGDTWKDKEGNEYLSIYCKSNSAKGYGSQYFDDSGKKVSIACGSYELMESYKGESEKEVTESSKDVPKEEVKEESEEVSGERANEVKKIKRLLTKYKNNKIDADELKDQIDEILEE